MTARIKRNFSFQAGVYFNKIYYLNLYTVLVYFDIETESTFEQSMAMERASHFFKHGLDNSILICQDNESVIEKYCDASLQVCTLPADPYDQILAIMLIKKLNAIMEGRMIATDISVTSLSSDDIHCLHSIEENSGPFNDLGWWNDPSPKCNNITSILSTKSKKLVKLMKPVLSWDDLGLGFDIKNNYPKENQTSEVVFVNFDKKADK